MTITPALLELGADALRSEAHRRRRAAEMFAGEVRADRLAGTVKDVRTPAVKVLDELGIAAGLEELATHIGARAVPDPVNPSLLIVLLEAALNEHASDEGLATPEAAAKTAYAVLELLQLEPYAPDAPPPAELPLEGAAEAILHDPDVAAARSVLREDDPADPIAVLS